MTALQGENGISVAGARPTEMERELGIYKSYLSALGFITSMLLEDPSDETLADVLRIVAEASRAVRCGLFLNAQDGTEEVAQLHLLWTAPQYQDVESSVERWRHIAYDRCPTLGDALRVGMLVYKNMSDLPYAEQEIFHQHRVRGLLFIPLLSDGDPIGFLLLASDQDKSAWLQIELRVLCAIANDIAAAFSRRRSEQVLIASESRLRALVGCTEDVVMEFDGRGILLNLWSHHPVLPKGNWIGQSIQAAFSEDMARALLLTGQRVLHTGNSDTVDFVVSALADHTTYFTARLQVVPTENGQGANVVALVRDVTEDIQDEARRKTLLDTLDLLEEAIIELSPGGALINASAAWATLRGIRLETIRHDLGRPLQEWLIAEDQGRLTKAIAALVAGARTTDVMRLRMQRDPGNLWVETKLLAHRSPHGDLLGIRAVVRDITTAQMHEERITQMALYDALTGLPNRILLDDHLHQAITRAQRSDSRVALGFIDMDHFKLINDTFGHKAGDQVLITLSTQLKSVLRDVDTLARWGGDEFVVLLPDLAPAADLRQISERLREVARQAVNIDGLETKPSISVGIAVYPEDADSAESLLSAADHTMYHAKAAGRNNVQFYADLMHSKSLTRETVAMQGRLTKAIESNQIQVYFQPIIHPETGAIYALEALARWFDEETGWINPTQFIPMAEKLGLIEDLGHSVMQQAFRCLAEWRTQGFTTRLAINVSRAQLFAHRFIARFRERLEHYRLEPEDIVIEITESLALTDFTRQAKHLRELSRSGFTIAIDDFGTGYSSLSQLHDMPADIIKVDVGFTSRLHTEEGRQIVQAIVRMGQALELDIVVEGVETREAAQFIQSLGVTRAQGLLYSPAVPPEICQKLLSGGMKIRC